MNFFKKSIFTVLVLLLSINLIFLSTSEIQALESSGNCNYNIDYKYDKTTKKVVLSGKGTMRNYGYDDFYHYYDPSPFESSDIECVVINEGVTTIGDRAFLGCSKLNRISIPNSITSIGVYSLAGCGNLKDIYYYGSEDEWSKILIGEGNTILTIAKIHFQNHEHLYEMISLSTPTHLMEGSAQFKCICNDSYIDSIPKLEDHNYTSKVTKEPTHLVKGETTFTCECGDTYTEIIAKLTGHTYEEVVVTAPTCTAKGYTTYTCACGDSYADNYTNELDHMYTSEVTTEPTHLTEGVKTFTCECGDSYIEAIANLEGHTYTSEVTKEATHLEEGEMTFTCECGDSYTEVIEKIVKHNYKEDVTEPTCTAKGYTTYTCECGDIYVADYTKAKGHIYSVTTTQPTCIQNGLVTTFCTSCGDTHTETLEPTGHSFAEGSSKCENCNFDKADDCSCNCHKGGISGLIFKIILFFQRIFKTNKTCACGIAHY